MDRAAKPRALIAALRGGEGKTMVSVGLAAAWREQGRAVAPFKKGPDYIDAAWLTAAAGRACRNLDLFLMPPEAVLRSFATSSAPADVALIEGNRGLHDGMDASGTYSTAELAKRLQAPVLLVVDGTKSTRTVAAMVLGCQQLDPGVPIRGVILNCVSGKRHGAVIREAVERICGLPVLGTIPRLAQGPFLDRHLGLVPPAEHGDRSAAIQEAARIVKTYLDLDGILRIAQTAPPWALPLVAQLSRGPSEKPAVRIGVCRDAAFQFYYPENTEALAAQGAILVEVSPLADAVLPQVDALYIGGGFPETFAAKLAANESFRASLRGMIERGLPVYAECGGAMYLGRRLRMGGAWHPMVGALPVEWAFGAKPQGHGYTVLETVAGNPFFAVGESLRGHEFHYMYAQGMPAENLAFAFRVKRGYGFDGWRDGLCYKNVLACLTHVHALGVESWAGSLVEQASRFRDGDLEPAGCGAEGPRLSAAKLIR